MFINKYLSLSLSYPFFNKIFKNDYVKRLLGLHQSLGDLVIFNKINWAWFLLLTSDILECLSKLN